MKMARDANQQYPWRKCFYCDREATNITIEDEDVMLYLCEKHLKLFRAHNPKNRYKDKQDEE